MPKSFLVFWLSTAVASIGGFFTVVAIPWLTLSFTDSALVLSSVIACMSLPHSVFILFGGALSDIYRPIHVLLFARLLLKATLIVLCALIFSGELVLWHLYPVAILLGCSGSIAASAAQATPPFLVQSHKLQLCNGILMGTNQAAQVVGPALAAWLIYFSRENLSVGTANPDRTAVGYALLVDVFGLAVSILLVARVRLDTWVRSADSRVVESLKKGIRWCIKDQAMCLVLCYLALASLFIHGPLAIALPLLAKSHFSNDVTDFGQLYSFLGGGALIGSIVAIKLTIPARLLSLAVIAGDLISGTMLLGVANAQYLWVASVNIFLIGFSLGMISVSGITWFQQRTPGVYMGRVMSLLLFAVFGLTPLSTALSGVFADFFSIQILLKGSAVILIALALAGLAIPKFRQAGNFPAQTV